METQSQRFLISLANGDLTRVSYFFFLFFYTGFLNRVFHAVFFRFPFSLYIFSEKVSIQCIYFLGCTLFNYTDNAFFQWLLGPQKTWLCLCCRGYRFYQKKRIWAVLIVKPFPIPEPLTDQIYEFLICEASNFISVVLKVPRSNKISAIHSV